jgi:hypothetical protein
MIGTNFEAYYTYALIAPAASSKVHVHSSALRDAPSDISYHKKSLVIPTKPITLPGYYLPPKPVEPSIKRAQQNSQVIVKDQCRSDISQPRGECGPSVKVQNILLF